MKKIKFWVAYGWSWTKTFLRRLWKKKSFYNLNRTSSYITKITKWQVREKMAQGIRWKQIGSLPENWKKIASDIHRDMQQNVKYITDMENYDMKEYWATSDEIIERMQDDCDGQATYVWRKLRDAGFPDDNIGIVIVYGHAFAVVMKGSEFWLLDNGYLSRVIVKSSDFFPVKRFILATKETKILEPLYGFNLFDFWDYSK